MRQRIPRRQKWIVETGKGRAVLRVRNRKFAAHGERGDERQDKKHERESEGALPMAFNADSRLEKNRVAALEQFRRSVCGSTAIFVSILHAYRLHRRGHMLPPCRICAFFDGNRLVQQKLL